jgi:arylsulfatase A-like enzyme
MLCLQMAAAFAVGRPNVLFFYTDDLGLREKTLVIFSSDNGAGRDRGSLEGCADALAPRIAKGDEL